MKEHKVWVDPKHNARPTRVHGEEEKTAKKRRERRQDKVNLKRELSYV